MKWGLKAFSKNSTYVSCSELMPGSLSLKALSSGWVEDAACQSWERDGSLCPPGFWAPVPGSAHA